MYEPMEASAGSCAKTSWIRIDEISSIDCILLRSKSVFKWESTAPITTACCVLAQRFDEHLNVALITITMMGVHSLCSHMQCRHAISFTPTGA
jgi:hypothetical protein